MEAEELFADRNTAVWVGVGALAALGFLLLARSSEGVKPALVGVMKEGHAFREWLLTRTERVRADFADAAAEARHAFEHERDLDALLAALAGDKELLARVEEFIRQQKASATGEGAGHA
jgi:hypothetical protein